MTEEFYELMETSSAKEALLMLSRRLPEPVVVLGGWGVYLTVTDSFHKAHGTSYLGSRDVDLGFHIDVNATEGQLRRGDFSKALKILEEMGYAPSGVFRYCRIIDKESGRAITEDAARSVPMHNLFYLFVDPMVDRLHPLHKKVFNIVPIQEPILEQALAREALIERKIDGSRVLVPEPSLLLATKMKAIPSRQKDDKRLKDACDIYALLWHSPVSYGQLVGTVTSEFPNICKAARKAITKKVGLEAARHLGVEPERFYGVIDGLRT